MRRLSLLASTVLFLAPAFVQSAVADDLSSFDHASAAVHVLENKYHWSACHWYEPWTWGQLCQAGTWAPFPTLDWWNSANALSATVVYTALSLDPSYLPLIHDAFYSRHDSDYTARNFNDDEGWWALAWIDVYDLLARKQDSRSGAYLERAEFIFNDMAKYWDSTCGGGIWWQKKPESYKNAIANELFMSIAAKLYNRTNDQQYLAWYNAEYQWFFSQSKMYVPGKLIIDGLNPSCVVATADAWTYNQGVVLAGLVEMQDWDVAKSIATTTINSPEVTWNGVLTEYGDHAGHVCSGPDCPQFKGIFMRNLGVLERSLPDSDPAKAAYASFIQTTADSLWEHDRTGSDRAPVFGVNWTGPVSGDLDMKTQSSAVDALVAAMGL